MRLSTKGRYAVTAMLDLAMHKDEGPVTLADISLNQGISLSYLEQLFAALRAKQLVRGVRGPGGGYYLAKELSEISVADVIIAVDEWGEMTRRGARKTVRRPVKNSLTHALWGELSGDIQGFLAAVTLDKLVERGRELEQTEEFAKEAEAA